MFQQLVKGAMFYLHTCQSLCTDHYSKAELLGTLMHYKLKFQMITTDQLTGCQLKLCMRGVRHWLHEKAYTHIYHV